MGVGVAFGVMAGIPTALLLLASNRRDAAERPRQLDAPPGYPQQPPVIVLTGGSHQAPPEYSPYGGRQGYAPALPDDYPAPREITVRPTASVERDWGEVDGW